MKIVDCCESRKQMGRACVSRISMKPSKIQGRTPREAFINAGKCRGRSVRQKNACGLRMPTQNRSARGR